MTSGRAFRRRALQVRADFAVLPEVRAFADAAAAEAGFDDEARYAVRMAFGEAVANAIEHGSAPGDAIELSVGVEDGALVLYVTDRGSFIPRVPPRGDLPERGRGLEFMQRMMDEVQVRPRRDGTVVRLTKRLPASER